MKRNIIQNNCLLNTKNNKSTINNKRLFPNIHLVKNINKNNNDKNIYSEIKILPKQKERVLSQTNINAHNDINNNKVKFGIHNKKNRLHFSQSEINIKPNNKNNYTNITSDDNKDYINSIYSNGEKIASLTKMKPNEIDKNFSSHNEIISDLLNKTEKLFDDLGMFLEQRNKKLFGNLNENNVIQSKKFLGLATKRNNLMFSPKRYQSKNIINNYNDKNSVRLKYNTILSSFKRNKSYATMNSFNENKNKKSVTDAIIQTLNTSEDNKQSMSINSDYSSSEDEEEENKYKDNIQKLKNENNNEIFNWDDKLDQILLKEYFLNKKSWVKISQKIPGSSENSVKNRFYSLLRQKVNKIKKEYKYKYINNFKHNNHENNNDIILLIKKEISINTEKSLNGNNINSDGKKENIFKNYYFDFESDLFNNKSKKKNYSVEILLEFLPELMEEKGINISEILDELKERKNTAAQKIFIIIEKHYNSYKNKNIDDNDISSISTDIEFNNLQNLQSEKLSIVIKNMKLKIMYKYFHRFRYNTLGL
jgi:hypothetical protein